MVPAAFVLLAAWPLTPSGKVDRRALPEPGEPAAKPGPSYQAPRTPLEERLAAIWSDVLHAERVGVHDNFFALGGDSLLSLQVVARALRAGLRLAPRQLFEAPTVAELAATLA